MWSQGVFYGLELVFGKALFAFGKVVPLGDHFPDALRMFGSEVIEFGAVFGEVVEFPAAEFCRGDLPVARAEGAIFLVVEVERVVGLALLSSKNGKEGFSDEGVDSSLVHHFHKGLPLTSWSFHSNSPASDFFGIRSFSRFEGGGHEVDEVGGLSGDAAGLGFEE